MKFNEDEAMMRWSIAGELWKELKANMCVGKKAVTSKKDCNKRFEWEMYDLLQEDMSLVCKLPMPDTYEFIDACDLIFDTTLKVPLSTFIASDALVTAGLREINKTSDQLKEKVLTDKFVTKTITELKTVTNKDPVRPITEDQAKAFLAHEILQNAEYRKLIGKKMYYIQLFHHKWQTKKFKTIVGGILFGLVFLLLASSSPKRGSLQQTIIVKK